MRPDPRPIAELRAGYFRIRLAKFGPWLPAALVDDDGRIVPHLNGQRWQPEYGQADADLIDRIWCWGREITTEEHAQMVADYKRAMSAAPESVTANPDRQYPPGKIPLRSMMP